MATPHKTTDSQFTRGTISDSELEYLTLMHADEPTRGGPRAAARRTGATGSRATLFFGALIGILLCVMVLGMWFATRADRPAVPRPDSAQRSLPPSAPTPG